MARHPPPLYESVTEGVAVRVRPKFMFDESEPSKHKYVWAYAVEVENTSGEDWQLVSRHWEIVDAEGRVQIVDGEGVVGEQPLIRSGEAYRYSSGAPLSTASGVMHGHYTMKNASGGVLEARIPMFSLDSPYERSRPS